MNNKITTVMNVNENEIRVMRINDKDYISLTDLARYKNESNPGDVIIKWMSNKSSFDFYCLWGELFNEDFKLAKSREFKNDICQKERLERLNNTTKKQLEILINYKNIMGLEKYDNNPKLVGDML